MDLNNDETVRIEEFSFGVQFFIANASITDIILLFNQLDANKDGQLDVYELTPLIPERVPNKSIRQLSYRAKKLEIMRSPQH